LSFKHNHGQGKKTDGGVGGKERMPEKRREEEAYGFGSIIFPQIAQQSLVKIKGRLRDDGGIGPL